jgi:hypothetical protein
MAAYNNGAEQYANQVEWNPQSISDVYRYIVSQYVDFIRNLKEGSTALLAGAGSSRDILMFLILNQYWQVYAYDASRELRQIGDRLLYPNSDEEAAILWNMIITLTADETLRTYPNGFISQIIKEYKDLHAGSESLAKKMGADRVATITALPLARSIVGKGKKDPQGGEGGRIVLDQSLHENLGIMYPDSITFNFIAAIATLQHLTKQETLSYCELAASKLREGGIFHFNVRVDTGLNQNGSKVQAGRVFADTILGEENTRYYTTFSLAELTELLEALQATLPSDFEVVLLSDLDQHYDHNKPPFAQVRITRKGS